MLRNLNFTTYQMLGFHFEGKNFDLSERISLYFKPNFQTYQLFDLINITLDGLISDLIFCKCSMK